MIRTSKVSVIIPVWNPGEGISRCVASLRGQTLKDIEMIFVDDCGTDGAMNVVRAAAAEDPRIRIITNAENLGAGASRNAGIGAARGEYLAFVDSDDYVNPCFLGKLYAKASSNNLDIVKGKCIHEREDGTIAPYLELNEIIRLGLNEGKPLFYVFGYQHHSAIYRRLLLVEHGIRYGTSRRVQDTTFLLKVCHRASSFGFEEEAEYHFCERGSSLMHDMHPHTLERMLHGFIEQMDYIVGHMGGEKFATLYVAVRVQYLLRMVSPYRKVMEGGGESDTCIHTYIHGVRHQMFRLSGEQRERIKTESFIVRALCDYEVALAERPFKLPWEEFKAEDYVETLEEWVGFLVDHPESTKGAENDLTRLVWETANCCYMTLDADDLEHSQRVRGRFSQQMEWLSEHGFRWNFGLVLNYVKRSLNNSNRLMANQRGGEAEKVIGSLGHTLRLTPEIKSWAEKSRELEVRGAYDYSVALRSHLWGEFRTIPEYLQMLSNWRAFLVSHPECGMLFIKGYRKFLDDTCVFVLEQEQAGAPTDALSDLEDKLREEWHGLPFRVRAKRRVDQAKGIARRFRAKMQAVGAKKP